MDDHDEIDGVEVFLAVEAPCEVGSLVGVAVESTTSGASESEDAVAKFCVQFEDVAYEERDVHVVAELVEELLGVPVCHSFTRQGIWSSFMTWLTSSPSIFCRLSPAARRRDAVAMLLTCRGNPLA